MLVVVATQTAAAAAWPWQGIQIVALSLLTDFFVTGMDLSSFCVTCTWPDLSPEIVLPAFLHHSSCHLYLGHLSQFLVPHIPCSWVSIFLNHITPLVQVQLSQFSYTLSTCFMLTHHNVFTHTLTLYVYCQYIALHSIYQVILQCPTGTCSIVPVFHPHCKLLFCQLISMYYLYAHSLFILSLLCIYHVVVQYVSTPHFYSQHVALWPIFYFWHLFSLLLTSPCHILSHQSDLQL